MKVSIIIPVLNEAARIEKLINLLENLDGNKEIIISDGGSTDGTLQKIKNFCGVTLINAKSGRASQMNEGAKFSTGDILWFLHADSIPADSSIQDITRAIEDGFIGGFFKLYFYDSHDKFMNFIARTSHIRGKNFCLIFGDQGLFLRRDIFMSLGGFADIALMEDWEFSRRLKNFHKGGCICALDSKMGTSARRYIENGQIRTWLKMNVIKFLYIIGVSTKFLRLLYDGRK